MKIIPAKIKLSNPELQALIIARSVCYKLDEETRQHEYFGDICYTAEQAGDRLSELFQLLEIEIKDE